MMLLIHKDKSIITRCGSKLFICYYTIFFSSHASAKSCLAKKNKIKHLAQLHFIYVMDAFMNVYKMTLLIIS